MVPSSPGKSTSRSLIAAAGAMSAAASAYAATFKGAGLASDFLAQLKAASDALDASLTNLGATKTTRSGATAGLSAEATRGRQAVKVLDAIVEPQLAGNILLLNEWRTARRFGGKKVPIASTSVDAAAKGTSAGPVAIPVATPVTAAAAAHTTTP